jgi:hypothetical protein
MKYHYAVRSLQEPGQINVVSLPAKAEVGQELRFDNTGDVYKVVWCAEPKATAAEAAALVINNEVSLRVELLKW